MTRAESFMKRGNCKNNHCSSMLNSAWSDLNKDCNISKLHDKCPNSKFGCQKIITFTPNQYMLDGDQLKASLKNFQRYWKSLEKISKASSQYG